MLKRLLMLSRLCGLINLGKALIRMGGDPVGGYFCWDWASGFNTAIKDVNSAVWAPTIRKFAAPPTRDGRVPVHYAVMLSIINPEKVDCIISFDDGFFEDGLVHGAGWPKR
jgi:hypothetical protein